jgi:hypothetical protein
MANPQNVRAALEKYHNSYHNPSLPKLELSGLYGIFPAASDRTACRAERSWPDYWPDVDELGVYFIFDRSLDLLYVGKAAILGRRLSEWLQYNDSRECNVIGTWSRRPEYIATVRLSAAFEASSLEEFLIADPCPSDSIAGKPMAKMAPAR